MRRSPCRWASHLDDFWEDEDGHMWMRMPSCLARTSTSTGTSLAEGSCGATRSAAAFSCLLEGERGIGEVYPLTQRQAIVTSVYGSFHKNFLSLVSCSRCSHLEIWCIISLWPRIWQSRVRSTENWTANADTSSAVVKPANGIDESAAFVVGYSMVPLMKSSRAKPGSFEDRSWDGSSCARTVCPFFRNALSHAAPLFSDVAGRFDAPCIVNPISHQKKKN